MSEKISPLIREWGLFTHHLKIRKRPLIRGGVIYPGVFIKRPSVSQKKVFFLAIWLIWLPTQSKSVVFFLANLFDLYGSLPFLNP